MKRFFIAAAVAAAAGLFAPAEASAQGPLRRMVFGVASARAVSASTSRDCQPRQSFAPVRNAVTYVQQNQPVRTFVQGVGNAVTSGIAQAKAERHAQLQMRAGHLGGAINGTHEGTGFSTVSREDAIRRCCYMGTMPISEIGTAQDRNGHWHAVAHYGASAVSAPTTMPSTVVLSGPGTPVVIPATGVAHIPERTVWRPTAEVQTATCNGPTCVPSRAAILSGR